MSSFSRSAEKTLCRAAHLFAMCGRSNYSWPAQACQLRQLEKNNGRRRKRNGSLHEEGESRNQPKTNGLPIKPLRYAGEEIVLNVCVSASAGAFATKMEMAVLTPPTRLQAD